MFPLKCKLLSEREDSSARTATDCRAWRGFTFCTRFQLVSSHGRRHVFPCHAGLDHPDKVWHLKLASLLWKKKKKKTCMWNKWSQSLWMRKRSSWKAQLRAEQRFADNNVDLRPVRTFKTAQRLKFPSRCISQHLPWICGNPAPLQPGTVCSFQATGQ